jgi:hypothetical protein
MPNPSRLILCMLAGALILGCDDRDAEGVRVQMVPKQPNSTTAPSLAAAPHWTVPPGWKSLPASQIRFAAFQVSPDHPDVVLTVIPLGTQQMLPNIVRWQGQIGLPPSTEADLPKLLRRIEVAGHPVELVDLMSPESANPRQRILGAILSHADRDWFFKLMGPADVVGAQKENFDAFVRSLHFDHGDEAAPPPMPMAGANQELPAGHPPVGATAAPGASGVASAATLTFDAPAGWTPQPPLPLRVVSFTAGEGDQRADVIVSQLSSTSSGSYLENVNRWRGQVGLPPIKQNEPQPSKPVIVGGIDGALFDLIGPADQPPVRRMLLAWVPRGDQWWFIKLVGPQATVNQQESNFSHFLESIRFVSGETH